MLLVNVIQSTVTTNEGSCSTWEFDMSVRAVLRTRDLAAAGAISVQQVRNYEAHGLLPMAPRGPTGYRLYTQQHLAALHTVRSLVPGYGWQRTSAIMQALHRGDLSAALALIDERHAEQARKRQQVEQTLVALRTLAARPMAGHHAQHAPPLHVGEAASVVGVRVSAVHFWEQLGLLHPQREPHSRYRLYDAQQLRQLQVVALLRDAGYSFNVIRSVLDALAAGRPEQAIVAVEQRREELTKISWSCIDALTQLRDYVRTYAPLPLPGVAAT
jgi:DNA-binding transcriptional MerR regulator